MQIIQTGGNPLKSETLWVPNIFLKDAEILIHHQMVSSQKGSAELTKSNQGNEGRKRHDHQK